MEVMDVEESDKSGVPPSDILDSSASEADENADPQLHHDILLELAKYLDVKKMKSARMVSSTWKKGLEDQFRTKAILEVGFNFELSIREFPKLFSPDTTNANPKLITSSIWIKRPKYLDHSLMNNWLETYGDQLTTLKLGYLISDTENSLKVSQKLFAPESIESILIHYCPNLKILKILTPFICEFMSIKSINPDPKAVKVALDYLEIGDDQSRGYSGYEFRWTATFLLNILKCIKSVKKVKIVAVRKKNLKCINEPEDKRSGVDNAKKVFSNIEELDLLCMTVDPRRLFDIEGVDEMRFTNLQKLRIGCFCTNYSYDSPVKLMRFLPALLTSVKDHLKELVFYQCSLEHECRTFVCPRIKDCILSQMPQLKIFRIDGIMQWDEPSLDFLQMLPALKQLRITLDLYCSSEREGVWDVNQIFNVNKSKKKIVHRNIEDLTFRGFTESSKHLDNIRFCCPNLKKLEVDFCGTPVFSMFGTHKKLKHLTIHLFEVFEPLGADDLEGLSGSGIENLCLERDRGFRKHPIRLDSIVNGCLASPSLKKLIIKGMKIRREDYQSTMEKLQASNLGLWLINCEILDGINADKDESLSSDDVDGSSDDTEDE